MTVYNVKVKWGKEVFTDVQLNATEEPIVFKAQLFALTGVQPDRQKVMLKGMTLKQNSWDGLKIKDGITFLMMGSKEEDIVASQVPAADAAGGGGGAGQVQFVEDMDEEQLATALQLPAGLVNLGNTCYLNATVQCLRTVPQLRQALSNFSSNYGVQSDGSFAGPVVSALRDLYASMDKAASLPPLVLLNVLHMAFPRFSECGEQGALMQQDANECWTEIVRMLQQKLPALDDGASGQSSGRKHASVIDQYFGCVLSAELQCTESDTEPVTVSEENFLQLSCFLTQEVKYLQSGLKLRLKEQITKRAESLGRDAVFTKTSRISRLPAYLTVQIVRFFYKEKEKINAKILKDVKFPLMLDVYELCSEQLQQRLLPARDRFKRHDDTVAQQVSAAATAAAAGRTAAASGDKSPAGAADEADLSQFMPFSFEDDSGSNNSGFYQLRAVLTHQGRSSSSGHYVAWVRHTPSGGAAGGAAGGGWVKCDDDTVTCVDEQAVLRLSGGGDWHCAYVLLYGPRLLPKSSGDQQQQQQEQEQQKDA